MSSSGFLGGKEKSDSRRTIVQKTHIPTVLRHEHSSLKQYQATNASFPTVLLLRNPANAIISYYKFMVRKSHTEQIPDSQFKTKKFRTFVEKAVSYWMELAVNSLLWTEAPLHVLYYERLVEEPLKELRSVLAFLRVPEDEGRMACIAEHLEGKFKRKGNKNIDPYTVQEKTSMAAAARAVNRTLQLLGYAPLPSYN
ncbi:WSC domain-containing protein 1 [Chionoecetes opilio]|uniref:WSC domain-containing protein 1 n=1 Tax=Chionoecetes opilio TaxID=41210 RepID=A0A8J4XQA2_CHIOP|nr:WSC domain-containing protein 1 [Chionoecetes opilio]